MVKMAFTGGGTGGHIYPGLAVAEYTRMEQDCSLFWIGSDAGMDRSIIEGAGIKFYGIPSGKLRRYFSFKNVTDLFRIAAGFFRARKILKQEKPGVLFSKGGFVSVPPCAAAASLGIPVYTHESDFSPGLATRINTRFASGIFTAYEETIGFFKAQYRERCRAAGNPVRSVFYRADPAEGRRFLGIRPDRPVLLVLGGSQGAREINELIAAMLPELLSFFTVVHQTGENQGFVSPVPEEAGEDRRYLAFPYIRDELPHVMAAADLIFGRSGAGTVWESAVLGKPMVLIPLSGSGTRGDQVENAAYFEKHGAALVFSRDRRESGYVLETLRSLAENREALERMAAASRRIASSNPGKEIAGILLEAAGEKEQKHEH